MNKFLKSIFVSYAVIFSSFAYAVEAPVYDVETYPSHAGTSTESASAAPNESETYTTDDGASAKPAAENAAMQPVATSYPSSAGLSVEQRLSKNEQQLNNLSESLGKVSQLQIDVQTLRGQVEDLTHQIVELQKQQKLQYDDLDKRLRPDASPADALLTGKSPTVKSNTSDANLAEEQDLYQSAYTSIKAKKYDAAAETLQKMLTKYPSGQFSSSAHYWLGELYGLMGKNDLALKEFSIIVKSYPNSSKVADAQLKLGLLYEGQLKWNDAKKAFKAVITKYPNSPSARLATEQLQNLKSAGH